MPVTSLAVSLTSPTATPLPVASHSPVPAPTPSESPTPTPTPAPVSQPATPSTSAPAPRGPVPVPRPPAGLLPAHTPPPATPAPAPSIASDPSPPALATSASAERQWGTSGHERDESHGAPDGLLLLLEWAPVAAVTQPTGALVPPIFAHLPLAAMTAATLALWLLAVGAAVWLLGGRAAFARWRTRHMSQARVRLAAQQGIDVNEMAALSDETLRTLQEQAAVDPLTGALSRKSGIASLERAVAVAERYSGSLCAAMVRLADAGEPEMDDQVLRGVAACLRQRLRAEDIIVRYSADEYLCVLVQAGPEDAQSVLAEIRESAQSRGFRIAYGIACYQTGDQPGDLIRRADQALGEHQLQAVAPAAGA